MLTTLAACAIAPQSSPPRVPHGSGELSSAQVLERIAFGSCNQEGLPQPLWAPILDTHPDLWMWLGDNIYADTEDMEVMRQKYTQQLVNDGYRRLRASVPVIGTWDDHDYGANNAGKQYPRKVESQQLFLDFLGVPATDLRRTRQGVYTSYIYGPIGKQVKVLLLDTRFHRDAPGATGDVLGTEQWRWLEAELRSSTAQLHLFISSIQVLSEEHKYEKWADFPQSRRRLLGLLSNTGIPGVILLSGDRHFAELSRLEEPSVGYPLYEITSSGLTHSWQQPPPESNRHRIGERWTELNFGLIIVEWSASPVITLQVRDRNSVVRLEQRLELHQLQRGATPQRIATR